MNVKRRVAFGVAALAASLMVAACGGGGVDREGTRDEIVSQLSDEGIEVDGDCLDGVFDEYSDDQLEAIDSAFAGGETTEESDALLTEILTCVTP